MSEQTQTPEAAAPKTEEQDPKTEPKQETKAEAKPEPKAEKTEESPAARFARLANAEKKLNAERQALKAEREKLEALKSEVATAKAKREEYARNPTKLLQDYGLSYDTVTKSILAGGKPTPETEIAATQESLAELKAQVEKLRIEREEAVRVAEESRRQAAIDEYRTGLVADAKAGGFDLVAEFDPKGEALYAEALKMHQETGEIPEPKAVLERVEQQIEAMVERVLKVPKVASRFKAPEKPEKPGSVTIDNKTAAASPVSPKPSFADREARALAAIERAIQRG